MASVVDSNSAMAVDGELKEASPQLTLLPAEMLHGIFQWLTPQDLSPLSRTCRYLHDYISGNQSLCKDVYLNFFDTPKEQDLDWEGLLHDIVRLHRTCTRLASVPNDAVLPFVHDTVVKLLRLASPAGGPAASIAPTYAASRNATLVARMFRDEPARTAFLTRSALFQRARHQPALDRTLSRASARLHCLYGRAVLNCGRTRSGRMHPYACAKVYDLRQHTAGTFWGPFLEDGSGRVDWERVEAVMVVLGANMRQARAGGSVWGGWDVPFAGSWPGSWFGDYGWRSGQPSEGLSSVALEDPYGVSGTWLRVVCFIDYNDFFAYNFPAEPETLAPGDPRPALEVEEATRLIIMKIRVVGIEAPGEADGQALPVVRFEGSSRALDDSWDDNADSDIRGTVRLTAEGEVRWTTFTILNGQERWRSESVQVGGVGAAGGVVGHWFDAHYDEHGPVGPTAFWKMTNPRGGPYDDEGIQVEDFIGLVDGFLGDSDSEWDEDYVVGMWGEDDVEEELDETDEGEALAEDLAMLGEDVEIVDLTAYGAEGQPGGQNGHT
ncbi:hypothetical protein ACHAQA_007467 [Verticillium albo-atrum]